MLLRGTTAALVVLLLAGARPARAEPLPIRCDAPPSPLAPERVRSLREVTLEDAGAGIVAIGARPGAFGATRVGVDAGALGRTVRNDLARLFAAVPGDASGADGMRLVVRIAHVSTTGTQGTLRGTVASRFVLSAALRADGGGGDERWSGSFEGRAERRILAWRNAHHAETLSEAYCVALGRLAGGLPRLAPGVALEAAPPPERDDAPLVSPRPLEGRVQVAFGAFAPRALPGAMFDLTTGGAWAAVPGVELGAALGWHHAAVGALTFAGSGRTAGALEVDEFPLLATVRIGRPGAPTLLPHAGLAGGWDLCFLAPPSGETEIFGGWTWQAFAGVALRISRQGTPTRATVGVEAVYQRARPAGYFPDAAGARRREVLDMTGGGLRLALGGEF